MGLVYLYESLRVPACCMLYAVCCMLSWTIYRKRSTAQPTLHTLSQSSKASVRADQRVAMQASRQSWRELACRPTFIQLAVSSKRAKESKSTRPTQSTTTHTGLAGVGCAKDWPFSISRIMNTNISLRPFYGYFFRTCMRRPSCCAVSWSSRHFQVVNFHLK